MNTWNQVVLPLLSVLLGVAGSRLADDLARRRRPGGDSGDYWVRVLFLSAGLLGVPVLLSTLAAPLLPDSLWQSGWHLQADRSGFLGRAPSTVYPLALLVPWILWGGILAARLIAGPTSRREARALAGGVGFRTGRRWVLLCALPLLVAGAMALPHLGGGSASYPAFTWSTLLLLSVSVAGVAWSAGTASPVAIAQRESAGPAPTLDEPQPWPQALRAHGLGVETILRRPRHEIPLALEPGAGRELGELLHRSGARGVAPELLQAAASLLTPGERHREALVLAPGDCGQEEVVATVAETVSRRFLQSCLVVTARDAGALAGRLRPWLRRPEDLVVGHPEATGPEVGIRVVEAGVLSDRLLMQWASSGPGPGTELRRLGLLVWWNVDDFTGIPGANLWAISRRLYRLVRRVDREDDLRTLVLARSRAHGSEQLQHFVRRLLPLALPSSAETHVPPRFPRPTQVHVLSPGVEAPAAADLREREHPLALRAALASVREGWKTHLELPTDVSRSEAQAGLQVAVEGRPLREHLTGRAGATDAMLREIGADGVLALPDRLAYGGREGKTDRSLHLGLLPVPNPYVRHLLEIGLEAQDRSDLPARTLICAEGHPSILRRHLLLALTEAPATLEDLKRDFRFEEQRIRSILEELDGNNQLERRPIRFLKRDGSMGRTFEYRSYSSRGYESRPLDTVGSHLVAVRAPEEADNVPLRVDPERLPILAYPQRIFHQGGRRYRIRDWNDVDKVVERRWLACREQGAWGHTCRVPRILLREIRPDAAPMDVGPGRLTLGRNAASVRYRERVSEVVELYRDGSGREALRTHLFDAISTRFDTRALLLHVPGGQDRRTLRSLAQALRHVLPVHLGITDDDMEVVPLEAEEAEGRLLHGVALVDLYPGGLGLVEALVDDTAFLLGLLEAARGWLRRCPCASEAGCPRCLASPAALARDPQPSRRSTLELLDEILTTL